MTIETASASASATRAPIQIRVEGDLVQLRDLPCVKSASAGPTFTTRFGFNRWSSVRDEEGKDGKKIQVPLMDLVLYTAASELMVSDELPAAAAGDAKAPANGEETVEDEEETVAKAGGQTAFSKFKAALDKACGNDNGFVPMFEPMVQGFAFYKSPKPERPRLPRGWRTAMDYICYRWRKPCADRGQTVVIPVEGMIDANRNPGKLVGPYKSPSGEWYFLGRNQIKKNCWAVIAFRPVCWDNTPRGPVANRRGMVVLLDAHAIVAIKVQRQEVIEASEAAMKRAVAKLEADNKSWKALSEQINAELNPAG